MKTNNSKGFTIWFTGLSGSGKTTLAHKVHEHLVKRGSMNIEILAKNVVKFKAGKGLKESV